MLNGCFYLNAQEKEAPAQKPGKAKQISSSLSF